jgi:hypothetical protein
MKNNKNRKLPGNLYAQTFESRVRQSALRYACVLAICAFPLLWIACENSTQHSEKTGKGTFRDVSGIYKLLDKNEKEHLGELSVYQKSADSILFFFKLKNGEKRGTLFQGAGIKGAEAYFFIKSEFADNPCEIKFHFSEKAVEVETVEGNLECGFGMNIVPDGQYSRISSRRPEYFEDAGERIYFGKTKPGDYNIF